MQSTLISLCLSLTALVLSLLSLREAKNTHTVKATDEEWKLIRDFADMVKGREREACEAFVRGKKS